jgi:hypothetical protein
MQHQNFRESKNLQALDSYSFTTALSAFDHVITFEHFFLREFTQAIVERAP